MADWSQYNFGGGQLGLDLDHHKILLTSVQALDNKLQYKVLSRWYLVLARISENLLQYQPSCFKGGKYLVVTLNAVVASPTAATPE